MALVAVALLATSLVVARVIGWAAGKLEQDG